MATLADIMVTLTLETSEFSKKLREAGQEINNFKNHMKQSTQNMSKEVSKNLSDTSEAIKSVSKSTQSTNDEVNKHTSKMSDSLKDVSRSARTLSRTMGTDMDSMARVLQAGQKEFDSFGMAGRHVSQEIKEKFMGLPKHLQRYVQRLTEAGQSTEGFAKLNEQYSKRIIDAMRRSNDYLQQKTTQSKRLMESFAKDTNLAPLTNKFLELGNRMETTAKKGSALNIALKRIGTNSSLKNLKDQIKLVEQGIMRSRGALLGFGVAGGLAIWGMVKLAIAVDKNVVPAFDRMKKAWFEAIEPFAQAFATALIAVMNFMSAIGNLVGAFSEAHPVIFNMIMAIGMLTLVLGALLAPLAVTGIWAEGLAASFTALWAIIGPFVTGMLAVVGVALAIATAIVVLFVAVQNLWKYSEGFRDAFISLWDRVKEAVIVQFVTPVMQAWDRLKEAFAGLLSSFTGGSGTMGEMWSLLGDKIGTVVNFVADAILPILSNAFQILGMVVTGVIDLLIQGLDWLSQMWSEHGSTISGIVSTLAGLVSTAFTTVTSYIASKAPQIRAIVENAFQAIQDIIDFVMKYIAPVVVGAFEVISSIISFIMPFVLSIIMDTWNNIKNVIDSALDIIQNAIQLFSNVLKGNWKGAWENVKNILKNAVKLIWNLVQLYFVGKVLKLFKLFGGKIKSALGPIKDKMLKPFKDGWTAVKKKVSDMKNGVSDKMNAVKSAVASKLNGLKEKMLKPFKDGYSAVKNKLSELKSNVGGKMSEIKSTVGSKLSGLKDKMTKPFTSAWDKIKGIPGKIKSAFSRIKISIPKPHLPKVSVTWTTVGKGKASVKLPKIHWNATGGIFNGASLLGGGQGVGEAGAEVVMPISHKRYMKPFSGAIASQLAKMGGSTEKSSGGNQYTINFNEPVVIREEADIQKIVDTLEKRRRISERASGTFSYA